MRKLTSEHLALFERRPGLVASDSKPLWGRMSSKIMIRHLRRALEISMGEVEVEDRSVPVLRAIVWILFFHVFTLWPPSMRRLPDEWLPPADQTFSAEKELLVEALGRFVRSLEFRLLRR